MTRISGFVNRQKGLGRPTKKDARELSKFTDFTFMDFDDIDDEDFDFDEYDEP